MTWLSSYAKERKKKPPPAGMGGTCKPAVEGHLEYQ